MGNEGKRKTLYKSLMPMDLLDVGNTKIVFDPTDNTFFRHSWQSPNDGLMNSFSIVIDPNMKEFYKLKDMH